MPELILQPKDVQDTSDEEVVCDEVIDPEEGNSRSGDDTDFSDSE